MNRFIAVWLLVVVTAPFAFAEEPVRERIEWLDIWVTNATKNDLPRVLFVGDSITRGYFSDAENHLKGTAHCARLATSKCVADPSFADELQLLLKQYDFDVIHFNNGLHGWGYTEEEYRTGLEKCLGTINKHAPDAKLVWAATTPVRKAGELEAFGDRNERARERNRIAAELMQQRKIPTNDLYGLVESHPEWSVNDGVHFNEAGRKAQGAAVAASVQKVLPPQNANEKPSSKNGQ